MGVLWCSGEGQRRSGRRVSGEGVQGRLGFEGDGFGEDEGGGVG